MLFIHDVLMPMILIKEVRGNQKILLLWDPKLKQNENSTTSQPPYLITGISGFCHVPLFLFLALLIYLQTKLHLLSKVCVLLMLHMVYTICHTPWVINRLFPPQLDLVCCCFEEEYTYSYSILNHSSHLMAWLKGFSYQTINGNAYIQIHISAFPILSYYDGNQGWSWKLRLVNQGWWLWSATSVTKVANHGYWPWLPTSVTPFFFIFYTFFKWLFRFSIIWCILHPKVIRYGKNLIGNEE